MALWNYCAICGKRIEAGEPCLGIEKKNTEIVWDSICFDCVKVENIPGREESVPITDLLARAEAAETRASDAERALRGMIEGYFRVNEVAKKILNYSKDDDTPGDMRDDLKEASTMLFRIDESFRKAERGTERAEKAERGRDAAVKELDGVAAAVDDLSDFIDEQIHPLIQYDMYLALRENADAISMWQYESEWRGQKEERE